MGKSYGQDRNHAKPAASVEGMRGSREKICSDGHNTVLTSKARKRLPKSTFATAPTAAAKAKGQKGSYPIPDASHARNALARVSQHGTPAQKAQVRAKVHSKFPGIGK